MLKVGSLFSGVGGIDRAFELAGASVAWQCEIDKQASQILRRHWLDVQRIDDVRRIRKRSVQRVDWIVGGFPCQDVSVAGRRAGLAGERSGLWHEFHRIIGEFSPAGVLIENVPGLLSSHAGADLAVILRGLGELGYGWAYRVLDAQWWGVAQRRRRVFIVGCLGGSPRRAAEILFERESLPWNPQPSRETGARVAACLSAGVASGRGVNRPGRRREDDFNVVTYNADDYANGTFEEDDCSRPITTTADRSRGAPVVVSPLAGHHPRNDADSVETMIPVAFDTTQVTSAANYSNPKPGDPCHPLAAGMHAPAVAFAIQERTVSENINNGPGGKGFQEGVAYTLEARHHQQSVAGQRYGVRRLTPRECERLQGLPDDWTLWGTHDDGNRVAMSDSARYRMIGNGVAVPVVFWIARRLIDLASPTTRIRHG